MHVVIRCDASRALGAGHLVRAVAMADAVRDAGHTVEISGEVSSAFAQGLLADRSLSLISPCADLGELAEARSAEVIHVDHHEIGLEARDQVNRVGALLSSMEGGTHGRRPADVVIDSVIGAEYRRRPDDGSTLVLRGVAYAPMRREVLSARMAREGRPDRTAAGDPANVVVVPGGTDAMGAAATLASVARRADGVGRLTVVAPSVEWDRVRRSAGDDVECVPPSPEFIGLAASADLVISAAGTTTWELACIGVPALLVAVVDNQVVGYEEAVARGIAKGLGHLADVEADLESARMVVERAVRQLQAGQSWTAAGKALIDGRGAERIIAAWSQVGAAA